MRVLSILLFLFISCRGHELIVERGGLDFLCKNFFSPIFFFSRSFVSSFPHHHHLPSWSCCLRQRRERKVWWSLSFSISLLSFVWQLLPPPPKKRCPPLNQPICCPAGYTCCISSLTGVANGCANIEAGGKCCSLHGQACGVNRECCGEACMIKVLFDDVVVCQPSLLKYSAN